MNARVSLLSLFSLLLCLPALAFPLLGVDSVRTAIYIAPIGGGSPVVSLNANTALIPASVTKCLTTASAMRLHNPSNRFATTASFSGAVDTQGILQGNLVITPSGDPTLESRHFKEYLGFADSVAEALQRLGIKGIAGKITVDTPAGADQSVPVGWTNEDRLWPYGASWHLLNYRDNQFTFSLPAGSVYPSVPGLKVNRLPATGKSKFSISYLPQSLTLNVHGKAPRGYTNDYSNPNPQATLIADLRQALKNRGIGVEDKQIEARGPVRNIVVHASPTYLEIMRSLMRRSDNTYAEAMLRSIHPSGTRAQALAKERRLWNLPNGIVVNDGSGLSRKNRLTARVLADVLTYMALHDPRYVSLFPKVGLEGTVRGLMKDSPLKGRLVLKSGSVNKVQAYAGYLLDAKGKPTHVIVMLSNNLPDHEALRKSLGRLLDRTFAPAPADSTAQKTPASQAKVQ